MGFCFCVCGLNYCNVLQHPGRNWYGGPRCHAANLLQKRAFFRHRPFLRAFRSAPRERNFIPRRGKSSSSAKKNESLVFSLLSRREKSRSVGGIKRDKGRKSLAEKMCELKRRARSRKAESSRLALFHIHLFPPISCF